MLPKSDDTAPATFCVAITKSDATNFAAGECRGIYVGVTGDVVVVTSRGDTVTFKAVPVGVLPVRAVRVNSTNTTATDMVALY